MKFLFALLLAYPAKADYLSDIFNSTYEEKEECTCPTFDDDAEAEHVSWDDIYLNEYPQGTEVIFIER